MHRNVRVKQTVFLQLTLFFVMSSRSSTLAILYFSLLKMNRKRGERQRQIKHQIFLKVKNATDLDATLKSHYIKNGMPKCCYWSTLKGEQKHVHCICSPHVCCQRLFFSAMALKNLGLLYSGRQVTHFLIQKSLLMCSATKSYDPRYSKEASC